jgi:hypothetical protein
MRIATPTIELPSTLDGRVRLGRGVFDSSC